MKLLILLLCALYPQGYGQWTGTVIDVDDVSVPPEVCIEDFESGKVWVPIDPDAVGEVEAEVGEHVTLVDSDFDGDVDYVSK